MVGIIDHSYHDARRSRYSQYDPWKGTEAQDADLKATMDLNNRDFVRALWREIETIQRRRNRSRLIG